MPSVQIIFALFFLAAPAALVFLTLRSSFAAKLGPIVLCYAIGLLLGLSGLIPESAQDIRNSVMEASLGLALPLLLFGVDIRAWTRVAGSAMVSMALAVVSVICVAALLFYLFRTQGLTDAEQLSGMAVGMYTGGIANMGAIKLALGIPEARYLLFATVDTVVGTVYLLLVLTVLPTMLSRFFAPFSEGAAEQIQQSDSVSPQSGNLVVQGVIALIAAAVCVGIAVALAPVLPFGNPQILTIVLLTTLGICGSLLPILRLNSAAPHMGMYLIYVFSFCVAASMDLTALMNLNLSVLIFVFAATFGSFGLHMLLARLARIDRDTFLITSVAAVMSPAFVPMVSRSLKNPAVLMSGMATGILGFAIGNYLGISLALMLAGKG